MIRHIRGTLLSIEPGAVVVEAGGIGYEVRIATNAAITAPLNSEVALHTYHVVREDAEELYGFPTVREREMFELLIGLPGIGPKSAIGVLSQADVRLIEEAASRGDASYLSKLSGIGKKSAEKIVLGLKDKVVAHSGPTPTSEDNDLIDALLALGYTNEEALRVMRDMPPHVTATKDRIKEALKMLGTKN
jgi:Holliday junction DNA helicase RuvA